MKLKCILKMVTATTINDHNNVTNQFKINHTGMAGDWIWSRCMHTSVPSIKTDIDVRKLKKSECWDK